MKLLLALFVPEVVLLVALMPMRVSVRGHLSLAMRKAEINVEVSGIALIRLRADVKRGEVRLNGRRLHGKTPKAKLAKRMLEAMRGADMKIDALVGNMTAMRACMLSALMENLKNCKIYCSPNDRLELDGSAMLKLSFVGLAAGMVGARIWI